MLKEHGITSYLDYGVDWSKWLQPGETISVSTWRIPVPLSFAQDGVEGGKLARIWIYIQFPVDNYGLIGKRFSIFNDIITTQGRKASRKITLEIRE